MKTKTSSSYQLLDVLQPKMRALYMYSNNPEYIYSSTQGTVCVVPRPSLKGYIMSLDGRPNCVLYPETRYYVDSPYRYFPTLKGILVEDYKRIKPNLVVYQLEDGSLLVADSEAIQKARHNTHNASSAMRYCYEHRVSDLVALDVLPEVIQWVF